MPTKGSIDSGIRKVFGWIFFFISSHKQRLPLEKAECRAFCLSSADKSAMNVCVNYIYSHLQVQAHELCDSHSI